MQPPNPQAPWCPNCRQELTAKDVLHSKTGPLKWTNVSIIYCAKCGVVLGGSAQV